MLTGKTFEEVVDGQVKEPVAIRNDEVLMVLRLSDAFVDLLAELPAARRPALSSIGRLTRRRSGRTLPQPNG